ncbi:MAG: response regulator [Wenzhouxiangellaceae bacterium]|nr:response regulator [Wenzhouxiangellaceae bacterium]
MSKRKWIELDTLDVLAVDDHSINREFIRAAIAPKVASLVLAKSGHEALDRSKGRHFDLVLMDLHMPDMDGISTWKALRESPVGGSAARVIALTADSRIEERERLRDAGFHGFLGKPVSVDLLLSTMSRVANGMDGFNDPDIDRSSRAMLLDDARAIKVNGNLERAVELRRALAAELRARLPELHQLIAEGRLESAEELIHQWAGLTGYAGATRLERACRDLEHCLQSELDSSPGMLYLELTRTLESTCQAITQQNPG